MADITSAGSGNFSAGATWVGGVVPGVGDTAIVATGHVVTINSNITCDSLFNNSNSGYFDLLDGFTVNADITGGASVTNNGTLRYNGTTSATINGNIYPTVTASAAGAINKTGTGTLNVFGIVRGSGSNANGINVNGAGLVNVTGDCFSEGITTGSGSAINVGSTSNVSIVIVGEVVASGNRICVSSTANTSIAITGNVSGSTTGNGIGVSATSGASNVDIVGNITASGGHGVSSGGQVVFGGTIADAPNGRAAIFAPILRCRINTNVQTIHRTPEVSNANGSPVIRASLDYVTNNVPVPADVRDGLVYADNQFTGTLKVPPTGSVALGVPTDNTTGTAALTPQDVWEYVIGSSDAETLLAGAATATDVSDAQTAIETKIDETESDIIQEITDNAITTQDIWEYNIDTGVEAGDRLLATATSDELAEAGITVEEIWDHAISDITTTDSIGARLKNASTVDTTGTQIAAFESE